MNARSRYFGRIRDGLGTDTDAVDMNLSSVCPTKLLARAGGDYSTTKPRPRK